MTHLIFVVLQAVMYLNSCHGHSVHRWVIADTPDGAVDTETTYCLPDDS